MVRHMTESAAPKVAEVWDDVPGWCNQPDTQEARRDFRYRFARTVEDPIDLLKDTLNRLPA